MKFESESNEKTYDGKELTITREQIHFVSGNIDEDEGYSYEIQEIKSITLAGESSSVFKVVIYKDGKDCTSHYKIDYNYGKLSVIVRDITLTAESAEKFYDGSPLTCNEIIYDEFALAEGDYISSYTIRGSQTNIGISSNVIDVTSIIIKNSSGQNVTSSYQITTIDGELKVSFNK